MLLGVRCSTREVADQQPRLGVNTVRDELTGAAAHGEKRAQRRDVGLAVANISAFIWCWNASSMRLCAHESEFVEQARERTKLESAMPIRSLHVFTGGGRHTKLRPVSDHSHCCVAEHGVDGGRNLCVIVATSTPNRFPAILEPRTDWCCTLMRGESVSAPSVESLNTRALAPPAAYTLSKACADQCPRYERSADSMNILKDAEPEHP